MYKHDKELRIKHFSGPEVSPMKLTESMSVVDLVDAYRKSGAYNAGRLAHACDVFGLMIDEGATIGMTIAGAMTPAGLNGALITAMEKGFIDFVISTGANLYHDMHYAMGMPPRQGTPHADDAELRRAGIERIYNIYITDDHLQKTDDLIQEICRKMPTGKPISTARLHQVIGTELLQTSKRPEDSFVAQAARYNVPLYVSSPGDSSIGLNVAEVKFSGRGPIIDPDLDTLETCAIVQSATKNGVVVVGGGSPKNFYLQTQPMLWQILDLDTPGHDYYVGITTDAPHWGGLSGATPQEAMSWGKIVPGQKNHVVVYSDATIALPILLAYGFATRKPRPRKELFGKLDGLGESLRKAVASASEKKGKR